MVMFMARFSKYEEWKKNNELESKLLLIEGWSRNGLTQQQIAKNLDINVDTLIEYKKKYTDFSDALKKGKEVVDIEVENALLKRALGYTVTLKEQKLDKDGCIHDLVKDVHIPADTTAQIFWLKNRKPDKWRDKVVDTENEEAITNASDILVKIRKTVDDRYERN